MKKKRFRLVVLAVLSAAAASVALTSCATTKGFGRDLQKLGSEIEEEANEHL